MKKFSLMKVKINLKIKKYKILDNNENLETCLTNEKNNYETLQSMKTEDIITNTSESKDDQKNVSLNSSKQMKSNNNYKRSNTIKLNREERKEKCNKSVSFADNSQVSNLSIVKTDECINTKEDKRRKQKEKLKKIYSKLGCPAEKEKSEKKDEKDSCMRRGTGTDLQVCKNGNFKKLQELMRKNLLGKSKENIENDGRSFSMQKDNYFSTKGNSDNEIDENEDLDFIRVRSKVVKKKSLRRNFSTAL